MVQREVSSKARSSDVCACSKELRRSWMNSSDVSMRLCDIPRAMIGMCVVALQSLVHTHIFFARSVPTMTSVYVRSVMTHDRPTTPEIRARLHPFTNNITVEHWEPGKIFATLPYSERLSNDRMYGRDVVFGVSDGENVYVTGYDLQSGARKHVTVFRDGGTMEVTVGVPTKAGGELTHMFAVFGHDLISPNVQNSTKRFAKLSHPQVLKLFRDQPMSAFRHIASDHAHRRAMAVVRRVRSRTRR